MLFPIFELRCCFLIRSFYYLKMTHLLFIDLVMKNDLELIHKVLKRGNQTDCILSAFDSTMEP